MNNNIDCLLIGHNELLLDSYLKEFENFGKDSGAYRDISMNYINIDGKAHSISDTFNYVKKIHNKDSDPGLSITESFSAAITYLGSFLHSAGYSFDYINSFQQNKEQLKEKLKSGNILSIAIITTFYVSHSPIIEIVDFIKTYNNFAKIIVGGPWVTKHFRCLSKDELNTVFQLVNADVYINSSQGEKALTEITGALKRSKDLVNIPNIYYKKGADYHFTYALQEQNHLENNLIHWELFRDRLPSLVNIRTSISCPFTCSFCGFPEHAGKYQTMAPEYIKILLKGLHDTQKVKSIHFVDDTFNFPPKRFKEILKMIIDNNFEFNWHSYFRCQYADEEMVKMMKDSGCRGVFLGIESGADSILRNMNKKVTSAEYLRGIELLNKHGIITFGNFIIGFPGENMDSVKQTSQFIRNSGLDFYRAQLWYCERITPIWNEKEYYNIKGDCFSWQHSSMNYIEACDIIDDIFCSIIDPIWIPQYNFDFASIWQIINRCYTMDQVKAFINAFNCGITEKITKKKKTDVSNECLLNLENSLNGTLSVSQSCSNSMLNALETNFEF